MGFEGSTQVGLRHVNYRLEIVYYSTHNLWKNLHKNWPHEDQKYVILIFHWEKGKKKLKKYIFLWGKLKKYEYQRWAIRNTVTHMSYQIATIENRNLWWKMTQFFGGFVWSRKGSALWKLVANSN